MLLAVHGGYFFLFSPVILLHFLFGKEVSCITGDVHVEAGVGQDDFESSFWPWDSEDRTKVKGLWVRHQQGHSSKQRVSRRDSDVTKNLLNICHVTGCYLHAFPNREGIKQKEGHVNFTQGPRWWGWRLRWAGECVSMKVQVSQSWNKQITFTLLPLPCTLSGVTTTFLEGVGGSHCLHILVPFCSPASIFASSLITLWKLLSPRSPVNSRKEASEVPSSQAPLLCYDSPHPTLPTSHTLSFLDLCEVVSFAELRP